jgi:outer membrane protein OmpA-like peptidoglycan-associated protein
VLDEVALRLKQDPAATARIIGYTDATGSPARNEELAMRRAESARRVLVERHGIDPSRIAVESRAANDPVAQNDTPDGRQQNRRVVITVRLGS